MTAQQFVEAVNGLGITLVPEPNVDQDAQYRCPGDPVLLEAGGKQRASVTLPEGLLLAEWAHGKRVLEIGTGLGVSTVCLAHGASEVVTVDPEPWCHSFNFPANVKCVSSIDLVEGEFDCAFIDGEHGFDDVSRDISDALLFVAEGGSIGFHDVCQEDVRRAVDSFAWGRVVTHETAGALTFCEVPA